MPTALLVILALCAPPAAVRADLFSLEAADFASLPAAAPRSAPEGVSASSGSAFAFDIDIASMHVGPGHLEIDLLAPRGPLSSHRGLEDRAANTPRVRVRPLPPAPSSATLLLWALGTVGGWQACRSARRIDFSHVGQVPDWYHTGGPTQIGHTIALDLDIGGCIALATPIATPHSTRWLPRAPRVTIALPAERCTESPRAPPLHS